MPRDHDRAPRAARPATSSATPALFASRTRVMKSSAMRDLMAITERPEVISLAGGLPDTSTFPAESLAALMAHVAADGAAARAAVRADRGHGRGAKDCIAEVMAAEGTRGRPARTSSSPPAASRSSTSSARR